MAERDDRTSRGERQRIGVTIWSIDPTSLPTDDSGKFEFLPGQSVLVRTKNPEIIPQGQAFQVRYVTDGRRRVPLRSSTPPIVGPKDEQQTFELYNTANRTVTVTVVSLSCHVNIYSHPQG